MKKGTTSTHAIQSSLSTTTAKRELNAIQFAVVAKSINNEDITNVPYIELTLN